jgi:hypothetical protein
MGLGYATPPFVVGMSIPTGVGCSQGGYAGDAGVWMQALAAQCDLLISHPNVANAAFTHCLPPNLWYVEGAAMDAWWAGQWLLQPTLHPHRIALVFDSGIAETTRTLQHNTALAMAQVHGLRVLGPYLTPQPLQLELSQHATGASGGGCTNLPVLLEACQQALADGATALAIVTLCPPVADETLDAAYSQAQGIDPIGGYEAAVSHAVTLALGVPCAHAPVFADPLAELECHTIVNPKVAAEVVAPTYLPCVLAGLRQAPLLVAPHLADPVLALPPSRVAAWVMPCDTLASPPVLGAWARGIPVITVASNTSVLNDTAEAVLGAEQAQAYQRKGLLVPVASYLEAAGLLGLWRQGRHLPPNL